MKLLKCRAASARPCASEKARNRLASARKGGVRATAVYEAAARCKVWKRDDPEPADWTFTVHDPLPITNGSPGLYGFTPVIGYFDNVEITESK